MMTERKKEDRESQDKEPAVTFSGNSFRTFKESTEILFSELTDSQKVYSSIQLTGSY